MNKRGEDLLLALLKDLGSVLKEQGLYSSKIPGFPLLCFQKKVVAIRNGQGCPLKQKKSIFYRGQKIYSFYYLL